MVNTHIREKSMPIAQRLEETAKSAGITIQGSWTDIAAHMIWIVLDAPNAHVINKMLIETKLMEWNNVTISPIIPVEEAIAMVAK